ncbi:MAG: tyrosine-type recombinase/integrase, partial [Halobacteriaceae archaeon]
MSGNQRDNDIQDLIDEWYEDGLLQGNSSGTMDTYLSNVKYFYQYTGLRPSEVDKHDLKEFLRHLKNEKEGRRGDEPGLSQSAINGYFSGLNSFYDYLKFEDYVDKNLIPPFRKRYLDNNSVDSQERQLISVSEMSGLVKSILKTRDKAIVLLFAKTGIRRGELIRIDVGDIDWEKQSIELKSRPKRTNTTVFFDDECAKVLKKWLDVRENAEPDTDALFINQEGERLKRHGVYSVVTKHAEKIGLHDPDSDDLQERFTPHCTRHWFTTHLRRSGMKREYIKELRGDTRNETIDTYNHIDMEELREAYLA